MAQIAESIRCSSLTSSYRITSKATTTCWGIYLSSRLCSKCVTFLAGGKCFKI